jgi:uncharacterized protein (DUF169 family)
MVTLEEVHELGTELERWLRMRVHPIAVKMLKDREDIPVDAVIPTRDWGHKFSLCQAFAKAQRNGLTLAMFKEDMWCFEPVIGLGLAKRISYFKEGNHRYPDSVRTLEDAGNWCRNMPHLKYGEYQGIAVGPVNTCSYMPQVITMHVNGMQTSQLLIVKNWIDGRDVHSQLSGHAVCNYAIVPPLLSGECTVAIPCKGDRRLAMAQDDEIMFSILPDVLPDFINGARFLQEHNWGIPMFQEYKEEYDLKPTYARLGEMLGMDMRKSPSREQKYQKY